MSIKSRIIKYIVKNNTYDVLIGIWEGIKKFVQQFGMFNNNEQDDRMYTESENEENEMNKRYSARGNQDADLFK